MNAGLFRARLAVCEDGSTSDHHPILRGRGPLEGIGPTWAPAPRRAWPWGLWNLPAFPVRGGPLHPPQPTQSAQEDRSNLVWVGLGRPTACTALLGGKFTPRACKLAGMGSLTMETVIVRGRREPGLITS